MTPPLYGPRAYRLAARLTVAQTAQRAGCDPSYIRQIERLYDRAAAGERVTLASPAAQRRHAHAVGGDLDFYYRLPPRHCDGCQPCRFVPNRRTRRNRRGPEQGQ